MRLAFLRLGLCLTLVAVADARPEQVAVLDFDTTGDAITDDELATLTDEMRGQVAKELAGRFGVMTRELMEQMVPAERMQCLAGEGACAARFGRELQAKYVFAGTVRKFAGNIVLKIETYESNGGLLIGSEQWQADGVSALLSKLSAEARTLTREWLRPQSGPVANKPMAFEARLGGEAGSFDLAGADEMVASFESEPTGAVVLLDGKVICKSAPCSKTVAAGRHQVTMSLEQYDDASSAVNLTRTSRAARLTLSPAFGTVTVESTPAGLPVLIDGKLKGDAPVTERLDPGPHDVLVRDRCYAATGERIVVEKGKSRTVRIAPPEKLAGIKVSAADDAGNDVEAEVEVDGRKLGATPVTAKVPMCAKKVVVTANGANKGEALALKEKEVKPIAVVFAATRAQAARPAVASRDAPMRASGAAVFKAAGLEWQAEPAPERLDWEAAKAYCESLSLSGGGWRLPDKGELSYLFEAKQSIPRNRGMPKEGSDWYWSSSPSGVYYAWRVGFGSGVVSDDDRRDRGAVRCAR